MIKVIVTLGLFCLFFQPSYSQKVKTKRIAPVAKFMEFPTIGFDSDVRTYQVNFTGDLDHLEPQIEIPGYLKMEGGADVTIVVSLDRVPITPWRDETSSTKNKDGKVTTYYHTNITGTSASSYRIHNASDVIIHEYTMPSVSESKSSKKFTSKSALSEWKKKNKNLYSSLRSEIQNKVVKSIGEDIGAKFGFNEASENVIYFIPKNKFATKEWDKLEEDLTTAFSKLTVTDNSAFKEDMNQVISFFESQVQDTNDEKFKEKLLSNLAYSYFWIEDYDKAKSTASMSDDLGLTKSFSDAMIAKIDPIQEALNHMDYSSRHFSRDLDEEKVMASATQEGDSSEGEVYGNAPQDENNAITEIPNLNSKSKIYNGIFHLKPESTHEYLVVVDYSQRSSEAFYKGGNVRIFKEEDDGVERLNFDLSKIDNFTFDDRYFEVITASGLPGTGPRLRLVEKIHDTEKWDLFVEFPYSAEDEKTLNLSGNFHLKPHDDKLINLAGLKFMNFSKSMSKLFSECELLSEDLKAKKYKRNTEDLIEIVDRANNCQ